MYEKAPGDDINVSYRQSDTSGFVSMDEKRRLGKLEGEITSLQNEVDKIMKMHTSDSDD